MNLNKLKPKPRKFCAIDASTNTLAFAVFDGNKIISFKPTSIGSIFLSNDILSTNKQKSPQELFILRLILIFLFLISLIIFSSLINLE
jgi:ssRNA-specific RNase YbeY (16S rRNA maturation enzyme)